MAVEQPTDVSAYIKEVKHKAISGRCKGNSIKGEHVSHDSLGLNWQATYIDTYLCFGCRHGSHFFPED